jgi:hypothetical protein
MSPSKYLYVTVGVGVFYPILFFVSLTSTTYFGLDSVFSDYLNNIMGFLVFLIPIFFLTLFFLGVFQFKKNTEKRSVMFYIIILNFIFFILTLWLLWATMADYGGDWSQSVPLL